MGWLCWADLRPPTRDEAVVVGGTLLLAFAASVPYSWSVMERASQAACPSFPPNVVLIGTVLALSAVTVLGTAGAGPWLYRRGLRVALVVNAATGIVGLVGASVAAYTCVDWLYLLTLGPLAGATTTIGYYTGVTLMMEWFPRHRGFAASWYGGALGVGSALFSSLEGALAVSVSVGTVWAVVAALMLLLTLPPIFLLSHPPPPPGGKPPAAAPRGGRKGSAICPPGFPWTLFALFWLGYFCSLTGGWAVISALDVIVNDVTALSASQTFGITSGVLWAYTLARFVSGPISDLIGQDGCYVVGTALEAVAYFILPSLAPWPAAFITVLAVAAFIMGSAKVMVAGYIFHHFKPAIALDMFSHSMAAFGVAGIVGSLTAQRLYTEAEADASIAPRDRAAKLFMVMGAISSAGCLAYLAMMVQSRVPWMTNALGGKAAVVVTGGDVKEAPLLGSDGSDGGGGAGGGALAPLLDGNETDDDSTRDGAGDTPRLLSPSDGVSAAAGGGAGGAAIVRSFSTTLSIPAGYSLPLMRGSMADTPDAGVTPMGVFPGALARETSRRNAHLLASLAAPAPSGDGPLLVDT